MKNKVINFYEQNNLIIKTALLFSIISYAGFVYNWTLALDDASDTFVPIFRTFLYGNSRISPIAFLTDYTILPSWNAILAIILLFFSSIVILFSISLFDEESHSQSKLANFVFLLVFNVSPTYCFYLKYNILNLTVSAAMTCVALSFLLGIISEQYKSKCSFVLSITLLYFAIAAYESFAVYYICLSLFVTVYRSILEDNISIKNIIKHQYVYSIRLLICLLIWVSIYYILIHAFHTLNYLSGYVSHEKLSLTVITRILGQLLDFDFNYWYRITLCCYVILMLGVLIKYRLRSIALIILMIIFVASPFMLIFVMRSFFPPRTLQSIPLFMSFAWFLIAYLSDKHFKSVKFINYLLCSFVLVFTLINAKQINFLSYSSYMHFEYDKNFANQIYNETVSAVGDDIKSKPLVIIGIHEYQDKPFFFNTTSDGLGYSFFNYRSDSYTVITNFMKWIGCEYIVANNEQTHKAVQYSLTMPAYPSKGYILDTESIIIVKLSAPYYNYSQIESSILNNLKVDHHNENIKASLDYIGERNGVIEYWGWSYLPNVDNSNYTTTIKLKNLTTTKSYQFISAKMKRQDVNGSLSDAVSINEVGFFGEIDKKLLPKGVYDISIQMISSKGYIEKNVNKAIEIK